MGIRNLFRQRTGRFFSFFNQLAGLVSTLLTILGFLGLSSLGVGVFIHVFPLMVIGGTVLLVAAPLVILHYTLIDEKVKQASAISTVSSSNMINAGNLNEQSIPSDTILSPPPSEEDFEVLLEELVYQYLGDGQTMYQRKRFRMRTLRNGVRDFIDRYRWTGHGTCIVRSLTPDYTIQQSEALGSYTNLKVIFPHPFFKDDVVDFTIEWELFDEGKTARNFLSTRVYRETKHLLMQVILPTELAPKRVYCYEFEPHRDDQPVIEQRVYWSPATQSIIYNIAEPKKYHKYLIQWYQE